MVKYSVNASDVSLPELSLIMPCYNEEKSVRGTVQRVVRAFEQAGHRVQLVVVDNGSTDRTKIQLDQLGRELPSVEVHSVERNVGYGNGILSGMKRCQAPWVGTIAADGQVDPEDVVRLFEDVNSTDGWVLGKVRRRFRMDGTKRKVISIAYNILVRSFWPGLDSLDINGIPKILPLKAARQMNLQSRGWFLDPEIMIKAYYMKLRVLELNVFARMRSRGLSHVRASTAWEFFRELVRYRFSTEISRWRQDLRKTSQA
jgi:glycosyltransferase involved in cell wall biosynthesis